MANVTTICLSNEKIQTITGTSNGKSVKLQDYNSIPLPAGAVINGVITNEFTTKNCLSEVKKKGVNAARLVINSSLILLRTAQVPIMYSRQMLNFVRNELSGFQGNYEDLLYDYSVVKRSHPQGGGVILCCGVERKMIDSYQELFQASGLKLTGVDVAINCANKLTSLLPELAGKTYILSILDGNNMISLLYEENSYIFSEHSRLFSDRETEGFATEVAGKISSLIQFNKSQKSEHAIENVYFCGLKTTEYRICTQISELLSIEVSELPNSSSIYLKDGTSDFRISDYVFSVGGLLRV